MGRLGDGKRFSHYTNFGVFDFPDRSEALRLNLDTWYYREGDVVGRMNLGQGPMSYEGGVVEFLWRQFDVFRAAFKPIADVQSPIEMSCHPIERRRGGTWHRVSLSDRNTFIRDLSDAMSSGKTLVGHAFAWLDGRIMVRASDGTLVEREVREMGRVWLSARLNHAAAETPKSPNLGIWTAILRLDYVSVFLKDNHLILDEVREHWRRLRSSNPSLTWNSDEHSVMPLVVTLADVPENTPRTNDVLYDRNAPRLVDSIRQWEAATGHPFEWRIALGDSGAK